MRKIITTPEKRDKLEPNYELGCKRILVSDNFYPAINKENVELITSAIDGFYEEGIVVQEKSP